MRSRQGAPAKPGFVKAVKLKSGASHIPRPIAASCRAPGAGVNCAPGRDRAGFSRFNVMQNTPALDALQLEEWLEKAGIEHYTCDQCNGLHLPRLQELEGAVDSRVFVEPWGILLSTEFVIRPTAMLVVAAD